MQLSSWFSKLDKIRPTHSKHHNSSHATSREHYSVSIRTHEAEEQDVKTKTKTQIITEDCSSTDEMERTTIVEMVPTTRVVEYVPSYIETATETITVLYDASKTASSTRSHKSKHTKHTWTEIVTTSSPTASKFSKSSKKHTRSKHTRSSKTTGSPSPSSSVSPTFSPKTEVVVTTSEVIEVVTVGYTEVTSTMTLTEGDSRLSSMSQTSSTGSSSAAYSIDRPIAPSWWPITFSADVVNGDVNAISTPKASSMSTSFRTIYPNATFKAHTSPDVLSHTTTPAKLPTTKIQGSDDIVEGLSAREDDDDPDHFSKKYLKPDKAMSKRMSRWSEHHSILMEKQSSYKHEAWIRSYEKSIKSADKASKKKHHHDDDEHFASAGMFARDDAAMTAPASARAVVTVTTTILPTQNETYSISIRTIHANKTGGAKNATVSMPSQTHSKASSKASRTSSGSSSKITSPSALEVNADAIITSEYPICMTPPCRRDIERIAPTKITLEVENASMSTMDSTSGSASTVSTVKESPSKASSTSVKSHGAAMSSKPGFTNSIITWRT